MTVSAKHPLYTDRLTDWELMRAAHEGERKVKSLTTKYLPATSGMSQDGMKQGQQGQIAYSDYITRAVFHDLVKSAVKGMVGVMHREPAVIEVPTAMEAMIEDATPDGETLNNLLRKINEQQLITGRLGLLAEVPDGLGPDAMPFVALYNAEHIINWDDGPREAGRQALQLVVLDESENERSGLFNWAWQEKYRVLATTGIVFGETVPVDGLLEGSYIAALVRGSDEPTSTDFFQPQIAGNPLEGIPFVFINSTDLAPDPDDPPLLGIGNLSMAIYRAEADYRQALHLQGQETFVTTGAEDEELQEGQSQRVGAGAYLSLPMGATAEYVGASADGITEQREAIEADKVAAASQGAAFLDNLGSSQQSGEALRVRIAAKTATCVDIVRTGAAGLENLLKTIAVWKGANPDEVKVEPNLDFADDPLTGKDLVEFMSAKTMGAPISLRSIHRIMQDRDLTEMEYEVELEEIEGEEPVGGTPDAGLPGEEDDEGEEDDQ